MTAVRPTDAHTVRTRSPASPALAAASVVLFALAVWMVSGAPSVGLAAEHSTATRLIASGLLGWTATVSITWFGPLPVGRACDRVLHVAAAFTGISVLLLAFGLALVAVSLF